MGRGEGREVNRLLAFLFLAVALLSMALGAGLASRSALEDPLIVAARATQETAKAQQEQARAEAERARAAREWASANEARVRAEAVAQSVDQMAAGLKVLAVGLPAAAVALAVIVAAAAGRWSWKRAGAPQLEAVYPKNGVSPILVIESAGQRWIVDTSRGLGSVTAIDADGSVSLPLAGAEDLHAQLSAQALAAGVIAGASGKEERTAAAAAVGRAVQDALGALPALAQNARPAVQTVFSSPKTDGGGEMRVVKRAVGPAPAARADAVRRGHMAEFITRGAVLGFTRRAWAGQKFTDGTAVSQTLWAKLTGTGKEAGIFTDDGQLRASVDETLAALGLEEFSSKEKR